MTAMNAVERAFEELQQAADAAEKASAEAIGLLRDIKKHTRLIDKDKMRFLSEFPEELYDRFYKFIVKHKEDD
jgi:hypothetical protein